MPDGRGGRLPGLSWSGPACCRAGRRACAGPRLSLSAKRRAAWALFEQVHHSLEIVRGRRLSACWRWRVSRRSSSTGRTRYRVIRLIGRVETAARGLSNPGDACAGPAARDRRPADRCHARQGGTDRARLDRAPRPLPFGRGREADKVERALARAAVSPLSADGGAPPLLATGGGLAGTR